MPLIELQNAAVWLDGREILHNLSWRLEASQNWAVRGPNGAGKSTFLRLVAGQIWPKIADSRRYGFEGVQTSSPLRARENIALLSPEMQEKYVRKLQDGPDNERGWQLTARETVLTGFFGSELLHQKPTNTQNERADAVFLQLGIENLAARRLETLSQGEMRKVLLARALVSSPQVLLLDEACAGLDAASRENMLALVQNIAESGTQIVMTTHRDSEMVAAIDWVLELPEGMKRNRSGTCVLFQSPPSISRLEEDASSVSGEVLIRLENVAVILDEKPVFQNLGWELRRGEQWIVAGPNGSGKSTFLKLLRGQIWPALGGKIERFGESKPRAIWEIGECIALLSPELQARFSDQLPVETAIATGFFDSLGRVEELSDVQTARVAEVVREVGIEDLVGRTFGRLSYGQTRRVLLARALVQKPEILLLDEPFDGLDWAAREEFAALLEKQAQNGVSLVLVSHHEADWPAFVTHILRLNFASQGVPGVDRR